MKNQTQVVVTGLAWMGSGIGSIESAMERIFRQAEHEILITTFSISNETDLLLEWLEGALARGILVKIIINNIQEQPIEVIERIKELSRSYSHLYLYNFEGGQGRDLHAKVITADRKIALVGSSNLSRRGLQNNHELALFIQGFSAEKVSQALDKLLSSALATRI
jgi:cardiolipin synthase